MMPSRAGLKTKTPATRGLMDSTLVLAVGSATTRLPNYVVSQHAASFMPTLVQGLTATLSPGIGLNKLDAGFHPVGWRWIETPPFLEFEPATAPDWTVNVDPAVAEFLCQERAKAQPAETGGYLYGGWDAALKQMVIVAASGLPPRSEASKAALILGPAGFTPAEKRIARRARKRLQLCGSWHSHPGRSTALSAKDEAAMETFRCLNRTPRRSDPFGCGRKGWA